MSSSISSNKYKKVAKEPVHNSLLADEVKRACDKFFRSRGMGYGRGLYSKPRAVPERSLGGK